ncbi:MAG: hypothetical protein A2Z91_09605 [Deltaproteobacteria bacterium GWA2_38_16]|nr:MAG: hypothetical protein A2Z91_09605 [Deltaproteobacteria bacterium GWA2_38_16]OGQ02453.1 MAG: hypothetical protein A3D19_09125 [Deltaproteobacteria bacterium RIFCSPHIGHO2_02_FULL_38_15]OGQ34871.1 MAG: hypothetical protein A3A72_02655 [Deltaproteobacteria bacterium RIFCSPLOWO2_01_FULL_38_9]OGQ60000.1 MAG: hypothetical protein A3G92_02420 [Deltaproteobacteria bacterium RIFCSPLOWO2_12_FULL_38_8]HBQ21094.1 MBL fold metallo-hydrolase [Deltaproteobacteria bacterium]
MNIHCFTVGPFLEHTYIVSDPESKEAIVIDPGGENEKILKYLKEKELHLKGIYSTHGHIDHVAGAYELHQLTQIPYRLNVKDKFLLDELPTISAYFGFSDIKIPVIHSTIEEGETIELGKQKINVIATPGHTPGGLCYFTEGNILVGDTLFQGSIGRTDLPGGNHEELLQSIKTKLLTLDDKLTVFCGHGPKTTIGREKEFNPFLIKGHSRFL